MAVIKRAIDISKYQGTIDWDKVKASGLVDYVIVRAGTGYGGNHKDDKFDYNMINLNRLGIPTGIYWFSYATNVAEATAEAKYCLEIVKPYRLELPIVWDFEYDSVTKAEKKGIKVTKALATNMAIAFMSTIENAKYYGMIYSNKHYLNTYFDSSIPKRYDLWYAAWPGGTIDITKTKPSMSCGIWQYGTTTVPGINGGVDGDVAYKDYPAIIKKAKLNNLDKPTAAEQENVKAVALSNALAKIKGNENAVKTVTEIASVLFKQTNKAVTQTGDTFQTAANYINSLGGYDILINLANSLK